MAEQTNNETQQHVQANSHHKIAKSNGINSEQASETTAKQELNGHSNGMYVNDYNQEIKGNYNGSDTSRNVIGVQSPRPSVGHIENTQVPVGRSGGAYAVQESEKIDIKPIPIGDPKIRSKIRFEVTTARVIETGGKKHVAYTIMMKRVGHEPHPAVIERRYNDFCFIYECILKSFHPSILGDFMFPKKVLIGNFKAEVISERTETFHKFLNLMSNCDSLLYSDYFYSFLTSEEHNEAVSHIKLGRFGEAVPLLETIFHIREKLLTASNIMVLLCLCELVACLQIVGRIEEAYAYTQVLMQCFELCRGHPEAECLRVAFLKLASQLAGNLGHDRKPFDRQLSEMRYAGVKIETSPPLLEIIRERYIHRASFSHTSKLS